MYTGPVSNLVMTYELWTTVKNLYVSRLGTNQQRLLNDPQKPARVTRGGLNAGDLPVEYGAEGTVPQERSFFGQSRHPEFHFANAIGGAVGDIQNIRRLKHYVRRVREGASGGCRRIIARS